MELITKNVITFLGSLGGITGLIVIVVKYYMKILSEKLTKEYDAKLKKEIEQFKCNLDTQKHITQTQYNLELEIYRKLSKSLYSVIVKITTITTNHHKDGLTKSQLLEFEKNNFEDTVKIVSEFQNILHENEAFIPENIYNKYDAMYNIINKLFWKYKNQLVRYVERDIENSEIFSYEDQRLASELQSLNIELNKTLREYLYNLKIIN